MVSKSIQSRETRVFTHWHAGATLGCRERRAWSSGFLLSIVRICAAAFQTQIRTSPVLPARKLPARQCIAQHRWSERLGGTASMLLAESREYFDVTRNLALRC